MPAKPVQAKGLKKARRLFRRTKYRQVINLLESQVFMYRENYSFYYMLGVSCLYTGDYGGAYSYLKRAAQLNPHDNASLQGLAIIHMKRGEFAEAIRLWLEILDNDPKNKTAQKALQFLRRHNEAEKVEAMFSSGKMKKFFPKPPGNFLNFIFLIEIVLLTAGIAVSIPTIIERLDTAGEQGRPGISSINLEEDTEEIRDFEGQFRYIMNEEEIKETIDLIGDYFNQYRDNYAMREINRILASNASPGIKEKVKTLRTYIKEPDFTNFTDSYSFSQVSEDPLLYNNCYIRWKGKVSNLDIGEDQIQFDFLVGYHDDRVLEGIVPVSIDFAVDIGNGNSIEIIGKIHSEEEGFRLKATSLRLIRPRAEK